MVLKKDGTIRVVFDYRLANNETIDQSYTMKDAEELMNMAAGHDFISTMDLTSGYHQVPMADDSKEITAFSAPGPAGGQYQFKVMPFGLKNAPATFQQFVDDVFRPYLGDFMVIYIDDVAIFSNSREEHLLHLRKAFQTMRDNQVYAKKPKCFFMQKRAPYLGHYISKEGIAMDPKKIEAVKNWPEIHNIKQLRGFLGLTGYYRKFIEGYSKTAIPLTRLLKDNTKWDWGEEQEQAKQQLIKKLTEGPILQKPNLKEPLILTTDASDDAIGAVLSQDNKPIAFLSKTFSDTERRWPIYEKELFAVVYALEKWDYWLLGADLTVITDNSAVTHVQKQAKLRPKVARWAELLGHFNPKFIHRPGTENKVADALSRMHILDIYGIEVVENQHWLERIRALTKKVTQPKDTTEHQGLYYKGDRIYIPGYRDIKTAILKEFHDVGHLGFRKTLAKVSASYWWEGLSKDVEKFVKSCDTCQRIKHSTQKPFGTLNPIEPPTGKFQTYSLDFIGPLPTTTNGHDAILVIVDMFTKGVTLTPIDFSYGAQKIAEIFRDKIYSKFGTPQKIISDRDPRFSGAFWRTFFELTGTTIAMSTAFHPQTDGQTERTNKTLEQVLKAHVNASQDDWDSLLPMAEFAINSAVNESTKFTPFQLIYGVQPKMPIKMGITMSTTPAAEDFFKEMQNAIAEARNNILQAQKNQKIQADKHRRDHKFKIGDLVGLNAKNLPIRTGSRKLAQKWVGPYRILKQYGKDSFKLDIPKSFRIHPTFHASLIKPWITSDDTDYPERKQQPPPPVIIDNEEEYEVRRISDKRVKHGQTQYLVEWEGYGREDATWEPLSNLRNARDQIDEFDRQQSQKSRRSYKSRKSHHQAKPLHIDAITIEDDPSPLLEFSFKTLISGQNDYKEGDDRTEGTDIENSNPQQLTQESSNMQTYNQHVYRFDEENQEVKNIERRADKIRTYSIRRFVKVQNLDGEPRMGYHDEKGVFYFSVATLMFMEHHTTACNCSNCQWIRDYDEELDHAYDGFNNTSTARRPSPYEVPRPVSQPIQFGRRTRTTKSRTPTPYPQPSNQWVANIFDNQQPEQSQPPVRPKTKAELETEIDQLVDQISNMDPIAKKIIPKLPIRHHKHNPRSLQNILHTLRRAAEILDDAIEGRTSRGSAHREYAMFVRKCEHNTPIYHAEAECNECRITELELDQSYTEGWGTN